MIKFNKQTVQDELDEFITATQNILQLQHNGISESLQKQWNLEIGLARIASMFLKGFEE